MNTIQKALEMQGVFAGWSGEEPQTINQLSKRYLDGKDEEGYPRVIRSATDNGNVIKIGQLKEDYKALLAKISQKEVDL